MTENPRGRPPPRTERDTATTPPGTGNFAELFPDLAKRIEERQQWAERNGAAREANDRHRREVETAESVAKLARRLGARYSPDRVSLDRFETHHPAQPPVLARVRAIALGVGEFVASGRGLVLYGSVGTGKDHLLAALLYAASAAGLSADWTNGLEMLGIFRDAMGSDELEGSLIARFAGPAVLGIRDPLPPVGESSSWRTETLYRVLDARYRRMRPTWMTLNVISIDEADRALSAPVFDRLRDDAELLRCFWPSYRERNS